MEQTRYSITEASKKVGIGRTKFYKDYINKGIVSKTRDGKKVYIDASELKRVFPEVFQKDEMIVHDVKVEHIRKDYQIEYLEKENELLKKQLEEVKQDKEHYRQLALENMGKSDKQENKKTWFDRIFG